MPSLRTFIASLVLIATIPLPVLAAPVPAPQSQPRAVGIDGIDPSILGSLLPNLPLPLLGKTAERSILSDATESLAAGKGLNALGTISTQDRVQPVANSVSEEGRSHQDLKSATLARRGVINGGADSGDILKKANLLGAY